MTSQFDLPCQCGKKIEVNSSEAGGVALCQCGSSLTIPSLSELKRSVMGPTTDVDRDQVATGSLGQREYLVIGIFVLFTAVGVLFPSAKLAVGIAALLAMSIGQWWLVLLSASENGPLFFLTVFVPFVPIVFAYHRMDIAKLPVVICLSSLFTLVAFVAAASAQLPS